MSAVHPKFAALFAECASLRVTDADLDGCMEFLRRLKAKRDRKFAHVAGETPAAGAQP